MSEPPSPNADGSATRSARKVQRVTPSMVASARAQITIARQLGKTVPAVVRKVAQAR